MAQHTTGNHIGILDFHGDGLGVISSRIVHINLSGNGGEAFGYCGDHTIRIHFHDTGVSRGESNLGSTREVSVQLVIDPYGFRGIHAQAIVIVAEETHITGITDQLIFTCKHIICLLCYIAGQLEPVNCGLIEVLEAFISLSQNLDLKLNLLGGFAGIAQGDPSDTGLLGNDLAIDHIGNAGLAGTDIQQLCPLGNGIDQGVHAVQLVGAHNQGVIHQAVHEEVQIVAGHTDLVGSVVQSVVIAGDHKCSIVVIAPTVLQIVDVISQLEGHNGSAVALGVNGSHILVEGTHLHCQLAVFIGAGGNIAQLHGHCVVVVVDSHIGIQTVLLQSLIVLVTEFNIVDNGCLEVDDQRELEYILLVGILTAILVVQVSFHTNSVLGVVLQVVVHGIELDLHACGIDGAAVTIGLTDIRIHDFVDDLAGGVIGDGYDNLGCVTQHTGPDITQRMDRAFLVGKCDEVLVCGDDHIAGILHEVVGAHVADVVLGQTADGAGSKCVGHNLVLHSDGVIQFVSIGLKVVQVQLRSHSPVAIESQIRHAHIHFGAGSCGQGDKAFHIHTVLEGFVQILLVLFAQGDLNGDLGFLAGFHGQVLVRYGATGHADYLEGSAGQRISSFSNGGQTVCGQGLADAFGQNICAQIIGQSAVAEVLHGEGHFVHTGLLLVIAQLQLGLVHDLAVLVVGHNDSLALDSADQVSQACALLSDSVGLTVLVDHDICGGHHQAVNHMIDGHIVIGDVGEVLHNILTHQQGQTCHIGASHRGTGQAVVAAAGNGGQNVTTVLGDLRLDLQAGSGAPGGEVGHEGAGLLVLADGQHATTGSSQHLTIVLGDGAACQSCLADVHSDITGYIIINDNTGCTLLLRDDSLLLEGDVATTNQCDLAVYIHTAIVCSTADAGDHHELNVLCILGTQQRIEEAVFLACIGIGLVEVHNGLAQLDVGSLDTVDGGNGHSALISTGRTNRTAIGVGGQRQVTVLIGTECGVVGVGSCNNQADTCVTDLLVNTEHHLFVALTGKACGSTQRHIDNIHAQDHAVFQSGQNPGRNSGVIYIGEHLHGHQLCIGCNAGDGVVLTNDDTRNVGTMVVVGGIGVGVLICVVEAEGDLIADKDIIHGQACELLACQGVAQQACHLIVGQAQVVGMEIIGGECAVCVVNTGIQNCDHHAFTVVLDIGAVNDTGVIDINGVLHQLGLSNLVDFTYHNLHAGVQALADRLEVTGTNCDFKTTQQDGVVITLGVADCQLVQLFQDLGLLAGNLLLNFFCIVALQSILAKGHGLVRFLVCVHQVHDIYIDDNGNYIIILYTLGQLICNGAVQIVLQIQTGNILHQIDVGSLIAGSFCLRSSKNAKQERCCQKCYQHSQQHLIVLFVVHLFFAFLIGFLHGR